MQHLLVYTGTRVASSGLTKLGWLTDPAVAPDGNGNPILPAPWYLQWAYVGGVNVTQVQLNVPALRVPFLPSLWPLNNAEAPTNDPNIADYRDDPFLLPMNQGIEIDTSNGLGANQHTVGLSISDTVAPSRLAAPAVFTNQATAAITTVAHTFVSGSITFQNSLPYGTYAVVGCLVQSATGVFARLIFPGQGWRPGVMAVTALTNRPPWAGRKQPIGILGTFVSTSPPQVEVFSTGVDTAQTLFMDLVKIS